MSKIRIEFPGTNFSPKELNLGDKFSENLTIENSPILFGCRTGICGTCLIKVEHAADGNTAPADKAEREVLDMIADKEPFARLACQMKASCHMAIRVLDENL